MLTKRQVVTLCWILLSLLVVSLLIIAYVFTHQSNKDKDKESTKICLREREYKELVAGTRANASQNGSKVSPASLRDRLVLNDPLYPALNRSETRTHDSTVQLVDKKQLYNSTQEFSDRYRLVAYVTSQDEKKDAGGNVWKLLARQRNRNQAEFYMIPANSNYDMKVMLNNDIVSGKEKLQDIYTIPKSLTFNSPLLNATPYEITELPMNDFTNAYN